MRPKELEDKVSSGVNYHILETFSPAAVHEVQLLEPIYNLIKDPNKQLNRRFSSPEAAMLLRDTMDMAYLPNSYLTPSDQMFSTVLKRPQESVEEYSRYKTLLEEYIKSDVKKFFNMDINDYLNLTPFERKSIIDVSKKYAAELVDIMKNSEKEAAKSTNDIKIPKVGGDDEVAELLGMR